MSTIRKFEDLKSWQQARELCNKIYNIAQETNLNKDYSLKDQILRSSGSVMDNIAEGFERDGKNEFIQMLSIAKASCGETSSQLYRLLDRKYITDDQFKELYELTQSIGNLIGGLMNYLQKTDIRGKKFKRNDSNQPSNTKN
jgi:four helix bundle protein